MAFTGPGHVLLVAQAGRLEYEALILMASLRRASPDWSGLVIIAEPLPEGAWAGHETRLSTAGRDLLTGLGAMILPFTARVFGASYPQGNKIEALSVLPPNEPFLFLDSDTLITGPLNRLPHDDLPPAASMRRSATWPVPPPYGPGYTAIWRSLYDRFGLDFDSSLDLSHPDEHWERYLYFNAGWFTGPDAAKFGRRYLDWAQQIRDTPHDALACQVLDPWLDQIILPLVIHSLGGGRPGPALAGLDGDLTFHYRKLPLLYATGSEEQITHLEASVADRQVKRHLKTWLPARKLIYQRKGRQKLRPMFAEQRLPLGEKVIRSRIRKAGWWLV